MELQSLVHYFATFSSQLSIRWLYHILYITLKADQNSFSVPKIYILGGFGHFYFWPKLPFALLLFLFSVENQYFCPKLIGKSCTEMVVHFKSVPSTASQTSCRALMPGFINSD